MDHYGIHFVAIIGGSVAGSEAANLLANKGYRVVVFDQKKLPYGKIEDGLPKWHIGLRNKEEELIDLRMSHENVHFVPEFTLGKNATVEELLDWGFSVVIIAIGAWFDRSIPIKGIEKYFNKGIIKQNDLVFWFNHKHEPGYSGAEYTIINNIAIIGGGLASLDIVKIIMIELVQEGLKKHLGVDVDLFTLEKAGVAKVLAEHNTSLAKLNIKACTLFYRRDAKDMPLYERKDNTPEKISQARRVSKKLLDNYLTKYQFNFEPRCIPKAIIEENNSLKGMVFQRVEIKDEKLTEIAGDVFNFRTNLIISSIGSIPNETPGLPMTRNMLKTTGAQGYRVEGLNNVFAIGNVVTGRGNIYESRKHSRQSTERIIEQHLKPSKKADLIRLQFENQFGNIKEGVAKKINNISSSLKKLSPPNKTTIDIILYKTKSMQQAAGFDGNYMQWVKQNLPIRLEDMLNTKATKL